jgi:alpha-galactosidase
MGLGQLRDGLAPTPPMGWNSWNRFAATVDERLVRETAEALVATGMRDAGYRYVVIDDGWQAEDRDADGELMPHPTKFRGGMKALADAVHGLGLRFGIYTDVGTKTCAGLPGSLGHESRDAHRFAEWGVDYVKIDWCHTEGLDPREMYGKWADALRASGRPIVFSICEWGKARPWEWASTIGHLWRTCWDILDRWDSLIGILDRQVDLHPYAGPDHWNDPDMLEVGNGGMTLAEYRSHFSLWAILAAPLMAGNDLRDMRDDVRAILTAPEIIAVDQDGAGKQGRRIRRDGDVELWVKELADDSRAVVLFNRGDVSREARVEWREVGWSDAPRRASVRDLWKRIDLGTIERGHALELPPHEAAMFTVARAPAV